MTWLKAQLNSFYRVLIRTLAFTIKDIRNILHQPRLVFSLILGPFLILLIFGLGYDQSSRVLDTLFVVPEGSEIADRLQVNIKNLPANLNYVGMTPDADEADRRLRRGDVDLVIVAPARPSDEWRQNEQARFTFYHNEIDPIEDTYVRVIGSRSIDELNQIVLAAMADQAKEDAAAYQEDLQAAREQATAVRQTLTRNDAAGAQQAISGLQQDVDLLSLAAGTGIVLLSSLEPAADAEGETAVPALLSRLESVQQNLATLGELDPAQDNFSEEAELAGRIETDLDQMDEMLTTFRQTDSRVLVEPFADETLSISGVALDPTHFYVPAVLSLLLQHIAITMAGLSIVREQKEGTLELFRAAPVSSFETLLGKYLGFLLLIGVLAAVLTALIIWGLGTPMLGSWEQLAITQLLLLLVSFSIGFHVSLSARSDSQAIQYSMIVLLASIFFTGFFLPLYRLRPIAEVISWLLPATYSTLLLKDVMLRGQTATALLQGILLLFFVGLFLLAWWRLYRRMRQE